MSPNGPKPQHPNSKEEMRRMQADAVRRVQEMQSRARLRVDPPRGNKPPGPPEKSQAPEKPEMTSQHSPQPSADTLLSSLMKDQERTLILALLVLLGGEKERSDLLFALLFLLL